LCIGVEDGDINPPKGGKSGKVFFSGKYQVKFGNFVNISCICFQAKIYYHLKLPELLRLCSMYLYLLQPQAIVYMSGCAI